MLRSKFTRIAIFIFCFMLFYIKTEAFETHIQKEIEQFLGSPGAEGPLKVTLGSNIAKVTIPKGYVLITGDYKQRFYSILGKGSTLESLAVILSKNNQNPYFVFIGLLNYGKLKEFPIQENVFENWKNTIKNSIHFEDKKFRISFEEEPFQNSKKNRIGYTLSIKNNQQEELIRKEYFLTNFGAVYIQEHRLRIDKNNLNFMNELCKSIEINTDFQWNYKSKYKKNTFTESEKFLDTLENKNTSLLVDQKVFKEVAPKSHTIFENEKLIYTIFTFFSIVMLLKWGRKFLKKLILWVRNRKNL